MISYSEHIWKCKYTASYTELYKLISKNVVKEFIAIAKDDLLINCYIVLDNGNKIYFRCYPSTYHRLFNCYGAYISFNAEV